MPVSYEENLRMSRRIAEKVAEKGGKAYYVGGFVRDRLMGISGKDIDVEIHGILPELLYSTLESVGQPTAMGASFGIYGLEHYDLDIAMPRKETVLGRGHKDFEIDIDPFLGTEKAAKRRDFTVNALMQDILTGEVLDHFGGLKDMDEGILRHVNDNSFAEDPLRVLRAAQFAARLRFRVAPETVRLCETMPLSALARERVMAETEKALLKAEKPSVFFQVLRNMKQLEEWFPEVKALIDVPQDPVFHPEGDVWNHTMQVLDRAASFRGDARDPLALMLSALCHDFGKTKTTEYLDGRIRSIGHEKEGIAIAETFLLRLTNETRRIKTILNHVELHMRPNQLASQHSGMKALYRLLDSSLCPEDLLLLARADRGSHVPAEDGLQAEEYLQNGLEGYCMLMAQPDITGTDLIHAGLRPGPAMGRALAYAHRLKLSGVNQKEALAQTIAFMKSNNG